jgi:methyl-accepting chemotaxis protein-like sensor
MTTSANREPRPAEHAPNPAPHPVPQPVPHAAAPHSPAHPAQGLALPPFSIPAFVVALVAGLAGHFIGGAAGFFVALVVAIFGAVGVALMSGSPARPSRRAVSEELERERERAALAAEHLEKARRHAELATTQFRDGKDPLTEVPELRVGPLRELLEAARENATIPVLSRLTMSEEELVGTDGESLPVPWPAGVGEDAEGPSAPAMPSESATSAEPPIAAVAASDAPPEPPRVFPVDPAARAGILRELNALISGLGELAAGVAVATTATDGSGRTPAQLVDAVVHTAADGIEDLAAGLMRANELAGVAERVTNKATLLALNAALEATRSGSEAFAAIAEETRRLAEFAREATDTISRLSSEIEYKVGETITAIHATSEDAKSAVATFQNTGGSSAPPLPTEAVEALLRRAQELKRRLLAEAA